MKKLHFLQHPKWRIGGYAALVTFAMIAIAVFINLGFDALEIKYGWRKDFSFNNLTTHSDTTRAVLKELPYPVHLYALYTPGEEDRQLMEVLNRYQAGSDLVTFEMLELSKNPGLISKFQSGSQEAITADSLIVSCETTGRYRILNVDSFASLGYDILQGGYSLEIVYEKSITESLLYVTRDDIPEIMLLTGHGELTGDRLQTLTQTLNRNNYTVRSVNLRNGDVLSADSVLMILAPNKDLDAEELQKITEFTSEGGALFITCDYDVDISSMANYMSLLRSYGMVPRDGVVMASVEETGTFYGSSQLFLIPHLMSSKATDSLLNEGMSYLIAPQSIAFETPAEGVSGLTVTPVLYSGYKAYLRNVSDGTLSYDQQEGDPIGPFPLALISERTQQDGKISRAFIIGNTQTLANSDLYAYCNNLEFSLRISEYLLNQEPISLNIVSKPYLRPGLQATSRTAGIAVVVILPLSVLVLALAVLLPRRHR